MQTSIIGVAAVIGPCLFVFTLLVFVIDVQAAIAGLGFDTPMTRALDALRGLSYRRSR